MTADPFSAPSNGQLFASSDVRDILSDERRAAAMVRVECALARANAACGLIPESAAQQIEGALAGFSPDLARLGTGADASGVPVPALVAQLREAVGGSVASYLHWGATSQDIVDTALILVLRDVIAYLDREIAATVQTLTALARRHRKTAMLARTRMQQAGLTTFALKVVSWRQPLVRHRARLGEMRPRILCLQLGGATGTLMPWGRQGSEVSRSMAAELELELQAVPWHTQRDGIVEFAGWLSLVTGALGTIGLDVSLLAQSEVGEVAETAEPGRGGSSTLPQKSNPVRSETLVALARYNANAAGAMHQALLHEGERSGSAWALEWLALPGMILAAGGAVEHAKQLVAGLVVNAARMRSNLDATDGLHLAEPAVFALSAHMSRHEAHTLVAEACRQTRQTGQPLLAVLRRLTDAPLDWGRLGDPDCHLGRAVELVDAALAA